MTCPRYYELRHRWELASLRSHAAETRDARQAEADTLQHLRAHAEECAECIQALARAFPELEGKTLILENLSEREPV